MDFVKHSLTPSSPHGWNGLKWGWPEEESINQEKSLNRGISNREQDGFEPLSIPVFRRIVCG